MKLCNMQVKKWQNGELFFLSQNLIKMISKLFSHVV